MFGLSDSLLFCDVAWYIVVSNADKTGGQGYCTLGTLSKIQGDCRMKNIATLDFVWWSSEYHHWFPVNTTWCILRLQMVEKTFRCGG
jgi:hypothetical protein